MKIDPNRDPLWKAKIHQNRTKSPSRKQHEKHIQGVSQKNAKTEAQHLPNQAFRLKGLHFLSFAASAKKCKQLLQNGPWNLPKILKIATRGLPKAITKISIKINTNRILPNPFWEQKMTRNSRPKSLLPGQLFEVIFGSFFEAASGRPADPKNHNKITEKHNFRLTCSMHVCICCSIRFV